MEIEAAKKQRNEMDQLRKERECVEDVRFWEWMHDTRCH
jgi:hypothetical protein